MKNKKTLLRDNNIKIHPNVKTVGTVYIEDHSCLIKPKGQRVTVDNPDLSKSIINYGMCTAPTVVEDGNKYIVKSGWTYELGSLLGKLKNDRDDVKHKLDRTLPNRRKLK